ncbi:MAG TPA: hypothetical protein PKD90_16420, partial [Phnomibacter sp.]|nr:hypothetical protein [Phnomibacter sp.]
MLLLAGLLKKRIAKAYLFVIVLCLSLPILPTCAQQRQGMFMDYQNQMAHLGRHINKVHQGKFGYLFIATNNGLVRFDGYRYQTIYRTAQGLTDNQVADVLEDRTGMLWVAGRHQGISQLNPSTGSWKRWPLLWPSKLGSQEIRKILLDTRGTLWLATQAGLGRYWAAKDSFLLHPLPDSNWHATGVKDIALDTQGNLWVLTAQMLYRFNITTHQWERFGATTHYQNQAITAWKSLSADSSGQLYLVSWSQGFYRFAAPWQSLEPLPERLTNDGSSIKG